MKIPRTRDVSRAICIGVIALVGLNAHAVGFGSCVSDPGEGVPSPIPCNATSITWCGTAHCISDPTVNTVCVPQTPGTVTCHNIPVTWTMSVLFVGGQLVYTDEGNEWEWDSPPAGCVNYVMTIDNGNTQVWDVYTPSVGTDVQTSALGDTCGTVDITI